MKVAWIPIEVSRPERRTKTLSIAPEMFVHLLTPDGKHLVRQQGIPEDAVILGLKWNLFGDTIDFLVYSDSFPVVPDAEHPPQLEVTYEALEAGI